MMAEKPAEKSAPKSPRKVGKPFTGADDPRRGRGPKKGAPNAGRPPDFLKQLKAQGAVAATEQVNKLLEAGTLNPDQLIKVAKEFDPADKTQAVDMTLTVRFADE